MKALFPWTDGAVGTALTEPDNLRMCEATFGPAERRGRETRSERWQWDQAAAEAFQDVAEAGGRVAQAMVASRIFLGENPAAPRLAYLANMAPGLVELRRTSRWSSERTDDSVGVAGSRLRAT